MSWLEGKTSYGWIRVLLVSAAAVGGLACSGSGDGGVGGGGGGGAGDEPQDDKHQAYEPSVPANGTTCAPTPEGSATNGTKTYYRYRASSTATTTWMSSKADCEAMGGKLAQPSSGSVNNTLRNMVSGNQPMWIGVFQPWNQTQVNGNWAFADGTAFVNNYTNWASSQPNDSDGVENNGQNCTYLTGSGADLGKWNDWPCYQSYTYDSVCEFSSTPTSCTGNNGCVLASGATSYSCVSCAQAANTSQTSTTNSSGCHVLSRDTSACQAARTSAGLSGVWLKFSCLVSLAKDTSNNVIATADGRPDYKSFYFPTTDGCYEPWGSGKHNPNTTAAKSYIITFPGTANTNCDATCKSMSGTAVVGLAVNGVPIYGNFAAPGDDIYSEAETFDKCSGHPESGGQYHYHAEPSSITNDDYNLVGVMRDGYPIYGRKDYINGVASYPSGLDADGGHTGYTPDSPGTQVYHYHVNEQTQTNASLSTYGDKQWFITTGTWHAAPSSCIGCN